MCQKCGHPNLKHFAKGGNGKVPPRTKMVQTRKARPVPYKKKPAKQAKEPKAPKKTKRAVTFLPEDHYKESVGSAQAQ